jgi:type VI secretion system protein ImpC
MRKNKKQSIYESFCSTLALKLPPKAVDLIAYSDRLVLANSSQTERLLSSIWVLFECLLEHKQPVSKIDRLLIDYFISVIDKKLSVQLDAILHHEDFQKLESSWRSLDYLMQRTAFHSNVKVELLNISKEALAANLEQVTDISQSGLYKQLYEDEYDMPGGEPISAIIADYEFDASAKDINLLKTISKHAAATHCPFIAAINSRFFGKNSFEDIANISDLSSYLERAEYIRWNDFRKSEEARYMGLTCPRFLLRLPYNSQTSNQLFNYDENVAESTEKYLWGNASFAFAANMVRSFCDYGWMVNIRGPESGGKVEGIPLHQYDLGHGLLTKIPTEIFISETKELELSELGFIPLSYYKNSDHACFFSANSTQKVKSYLTKEATANSRLNARLPYVFLSTRIAHYLKVLQREAIGSNVSRLDLEIRLNEWLKSLITKMNNPGSEQMALHPLRDGRVEVLEMDENPGFFKVVLYVMPHFQIEGVDVSLSVVGKMPRSKK